MKTTQCDRTLRHLREKGHVIHKRTKTSKNRYQESVSYAEYYLEEGTNA